MKPNVLQGKVKSNQNLQPHLRFVLIIAIYLILFFLLDLIAQKYEGLPGIVAWYPPTGLTYAFLLVFGLSFTPIVTIVILISSIVIYRLPQPPYLLFLWAFTASLIYGAAATFLVKRVHIDWQLRKFRDVSLFIFTSIFVSAFLAALSVLGSTLGSALPQSEVLSAIFNWWIGETVGVLTVTPFLLCYVMPWLKRFTEGQPTMLPASRSFSRPTLSVIGQVMSLVLMLNWVFGSRVPIEFRPFYLISLPLIWIALDHGIKGAVAGILALNFGEIFAIWIFRYDVPNLGDLHLLMILNCIVGLLMGAIVTERKLADEEYKKSEKRFRALIEHSLEEISLVSADGTLTYESPTTRRPLGYPPNSLVGNNIFDIFHPDDRAAATQLMEQALNHPGNVLEASFRLRHQDGSWRWMEGSLTNLLQEPAVKSLVINYRDITERKLAEQEIIDLAKFPSENPFPIIRLNKNGKVMYANPASKVVLDIWGCVVGEPAPKYWRALVVQALASKEIRTIDIDYDGKIYAMVVTPIAKQDYVNIYGRNITARIQAEEKIKVSKDELSMLFELSHSLAEADSLEDILNLVNRHAVESIHTTFAKIALLEGENYITRAAYPLRPLNHDLGIGERNPVASLPYIHRILEMNEVMILRAGDPEISKKEKKVLLLNFAQSLCLIPLCINDSSQASEKIMGLLMLGETRNEGREPFTSEKMRLAQTIGDSAAIAIRRMLLREQTERRLRQLVSLSEIDLAIISSSDMTFSLGVLLFQALDQLKVDAADVWLFNPKLQMLEFITSCGFRTPAFKVGKPLHLMDGNAGKAVLERRMIHVPDLRAQNVHPLLTKALAEEPYKDYYAVPLIVKDQVKGVMEVFHRSEIDETDEWLKFLITLANQAAIAIDSSSLFNDLEHSNTELTQAYDATIQGWSKALDLRDKETEGHTLRVAELTIKLGRLFGLSEENLIHVRRGALLHDIGKMGVPDGILLKPGPLTDEEWVIMKKHPTFAYELLYPIHYLRPAVDIPYCHHEKWDGKGYPRGLSRKQIPLAARIFAVVDVWDALTSDRPYREAWPEEKVLAHIRSLAGTHFDPQVAAICLESGLLTGKMKKRKQMKQVQWSEEFSVGVNELDQHHQQLIGLLNRMISATGTTVAHTETISGILVEMTHFAQTHFKAEEKLMAVYGYPGLKEQRKQHRAFRKKIADFTAAVSLGDKQIQDDLLKFLADWFNYHILESDMAYRPFFKEKSVW